MPKTIDRKFYLKLSTQERLDLIAEIWGSIDDVIAVPEEQLIKEVRDSIEEYHRDPSQACTWPDMARKLGWTT